MVLGMMSYEHKTTLTTVHSNLSSTNIKIRCWTSLSDHIFSSSRQNSHSFSDDNVYPHRAHIVDAYKVQHNIDSLPWPPMGHNLNLIEHVGCHSDGCKCPSTPCDTLQELDMALP